MSINAILPIATNSLRTNARVIADASSKIVEQSVLRKPADTENVLADRSDAHPVSGLFNNQASIMGHESFSDQDLLTQTIRIKHAEVAYKASASLIRTADEMSEVLLEAIS